MTDVRTDQPVPGGDDWPRLWLRDADYRALFYHLTGAAVIGAPDGRTLAANPAACRLFGRSEEELCALGRPPIQDPDDMRWAVALAERSLNGYVGADLRIRRRDGTIVEVELTSSIYLNEDGVERSLVLLNEKPGAVESPTPFAYDLVGHVKLTQAELRILRLLPTHHSIGDISESLCVGQNTAKTHLASIYRKLGVHNRASAVARARELGILPAILG